MSRYRTFFQRKRRQAILERGALEELRRLRQPLFRELERLLGDPDYTRGEEPHLCCTRRLNQMRISPLEARAILLAFRRERGLRAKLPAVVERVRRELETLADNTERQSFDCPLLEGTRCLVHHLAKPVGCLAWNPGRQYSRAAWRAFRERDKLNDRVYGPDWKLRVIPLWLRRVLKLPGEALRAGEPARSGRGPATASADRAPSFLLRPGPQERQRWQKRRGRRHRRQGAGGP